MVRVSDSPLAKVRLDDYFDGKATVEAIQRHAAANRRQRPDAPNVVKTLARVRLHRSPCVDTLLCECS